MQFFLGVFRVTILSSYYEQQVVEDYTTELLY